MKRLYVVVEGQTESEFIKSVVSPYLLQFSIYITPIVIHTSRSQRGGMTSYNHLRNEVSRLLKSGKDDFVVTTFIDFYRIPEVPGKEKWESITIDNDRVRVMRKCIDEEIGDRRFFSYIQLYEFEALFFANDNGFAKYFTDKQISETADIIAKYPNPEDINGGMETSPSKRILKIFPNYDKVVFGNVLALEVGIDAMLDKCQGFREWIEEIKKRCIGKQ